MRLKQKRGAAEEQRRRTEGWEASAKWFEIDLQAAQPTLN